MDILKIDKKRLPAINYFKNENEEVCAEYKSKSSPLYQVLADVGEKSIFLIADGGRGKSTTLRSLWLDSLCGNNNLKCIYVDLKLLDERGCEDAASGNVIAIRNYINEKLHISLNPFTSGLKDNPILLLDGANEAPELLRGKPNKDSQCFLVRECKELMKSFRVVISSRSKKISTNIYDQSKENRYSEEPDFKDDEIQYCDLQWLTDAFIEEKFSETTNNPALLSLLKNNMMFSMYSDMKAFGIEFAKNEKLTAGKLLECYFTVCFKAKFIKDTLNLKKYKNYEELLADIKRIQDNFIDKNKISQDSTNNDIAEQIKKYNAVYNYLVEHAFESSFKETDLANIGIMLLSLDHLSILIKNSDDTYIWANEIYQEFFEAKRICLCIDRMSKDSLSDEVIKAYELDFFKCCMIIRKSKHFYNVMQYVGEIGNLSKADLDRIYNKCLNSELFDVLTKCFIVIMALLYNTLPECIVEIPEYTFNNCKILNSITIPSSVTRIGERAFWGCSNLKSITIPSSVTGIGLEAFGGTAWYDSQPDGIVYAGKVAYNYKGTMPENTSIIIKDDTKGIGDSAFYECSGLTSITIPDSVTCIGPAAFYGCSSLQYNEFDNAYYLGNSINLFVVLIKAKDRNRTFYNINSDTNFIQDRAFADCVRLKRITIPASVMSIGNRAFSNCSSLTSITVDTNNKRYCSIGNCLIETDTKTLIRGCQTSIIPTDGNVTSIDNGAFWGCSSLKSIIIPDSVMSIGDWAFWGCSSLKSINIPASVISIGNRAFSGCSSLTNLTVDTNNKRYCSIGNCLIETVTKTLIRGCQTSIIPTDGSVTSIGKGAFSECSGLTSITIPDSVSSIGDSAFQRCNGLTNIIIPDSVISIGDSAFQGCNGLSNIIIPDSVSSIDNFAFNGCVNLKFVYISDSIENMGGWAFPWSVDIYCESPHKPEEWANYWCHPDAKVHWGVSREEYDAIVKAGEQI